jgi:hypothetical protein
MNAVQDDLGLSVVRERLLADIEADRRRFRWSRSEREYVRRAVEKSPAKTSAIAAVTGIPERTIRRWRSSACTADPDALEELRDLDAAPAAPTRLSDLFPGGPELIRRQLLAGAHRTWREMAIIRPEYKPLIPRHHVVAPPRKPLRGHPDNVAFVARWRARHRAQLPEPLEERSLLRSTPTGLRAGIVRRETPMPSLTGDGLTAVPGEKHDHYDDPEAT